MDTKITFLNAKNAKFGSTLRFQYFSVYTDSLIQRTTCEAHRSVSYTF